MNKLYFIASLPRSGSTLLSAILRQNPAIEAGMSSPVGGIFSAVQGAIGKKNEAAVFLDKARKAGMLRGVFNNYYFDNRDGREYPRCDACADGMMGEHRCKKCHGTGVLRFSPVVFDTNRIWLTKLPVLAKLFPESKMICLVRHPAWIVDSIERLIRSNPYDLSGIFGFEPNGTVYSRAQALAAPNGMIGFATNALKEAFYGEHADRLVFVEYQALCRDPGRIVRSLCRSLGIEPFDYDYNNIGNIPGVDDFDKQLATPGLHRVGPKVEWRERQTILPPDLFNSFARPFWRGENPRKVPVVHVDEPAIRAVA